MTDARFSSAGRRAYRRPRPGPVGNRGQEYQSERVVLRLWPTFPMAVQGVVRDWCHALFQRRDMSILQIHLELSDIPSNIPSIEDKQVKFNVEVENSDNLIHFNAKLQHYFFNEGAYKDLQLEPYEIVHLYRCENLRQNGARKVEEDSQNITYAQDEICHNREDLECYDKIVLLLKDIKGNVTNKLSLADLDFSYGVTQDTVRFKYCKSYIALFGMFTVTLWSGQKKAICVPDANDLKFICNKGEIHYRLKFKRIPFDW